MDGAGDASRAQGSGAADGNRSTDRDGYWFREDDSAVELLAALRTYQAAHTALRRRMSAAMDMNTTDLAALRHVIAHEMREEPLTARALARHLGISGASTSKLLDRLTASGHLRRAPNARDGRSSVVLATAHGHAQVRERLSGMHERMRAVAEEVPGGVRSEVAEFLRGIARVLEAESSSADPLTPADDPTPQG
jgi:DNA-binding MarR family transcriptional regulator